MLVILGSALFELDKTSQLMPNLTETSNACGGFWKVLLGCIKQSKVLHPVQRTFFFFKENMIANLDSQ